MKNTLLALTILLSINVQSAETTYSKEELSYCGGPNWDDCQWESERGTEEYRQCLDWITTCVKEMESDQINKDLFNLID